MAAVYKICILLTVALFLNENVYSKKTNFLRSFHMRIKKKSSKNGSKKAAVPATTTSEKETNQLVLAALYGGLGMGVQSAENFDYANSLNAKIQSAGGYGVPPGIYSYAFDPTTGMPFICDPSKTPPGGQSQVTTAAQPPPAKVPLAKVPPAKVPPAKVPPSKVPPAKVPPAKVPPAKVPPAKIPPAQPPPAATIAQAPVPGKPTPFQEDKPSVQSTENQKVINQNPVNMTPDKPTPNKNTQELKQHRLSTIDNMTKTMSRVSSKGNNGKGVDSNEGQNPTPSGDAIISPMKETKTNKLDKHIMLTTSAGKPTGFRDGQTPTSSGNQEIATNTNGDQNTATQNKLSGSKLTPLIKNTQPRSIVMKQKRSSSLSKLINGQKYRTSRRNIINIKLPNIPPCPDMKQFNWPWNCLENGKGNSIKKECIENFRREMLPHVGYSNELPFYNRR